MKNFEMEIVEEETIAGGIRVLKKIKGIE